MTETHECFELVPSDDLAAVNEAFCEATTEIVTNGIDMPNVEAVLEETESDEKDTAVLSIGYTTDGRDLGEMIDEAGFEHSGGKVGRYAGNDDEARAVMGLYLDELQTRLRESDAVDRVWRLS